jgi:arginine deiminase
LERVLVHTPGSELLAVTPANRDDFLFDDIIDLPLAQSEHARFKALLERFAEAYEVRDLLTEILEDEEPRRFLLEGARDVLDAESETELFDAPAERIVKVLIEGEEERRGPLAEYLNAGGYAFPPLPNLFFTRDAAMTVGSRVIVASMRHGTRWSEELLMKTLYRFHPWLANDGILYDGAEEKRMNHHVEGGDVHVLRRDLVLVGQSDRTSAATIDLLAERWFGETEIRDVLVVVLPRDDAAIHLDMIFTMIDRDLCCVYPPHFIGPARLPVLHLSKGKKGMKEMPNLFTALTRVGLPLEPIFCGGPRRSMQDREQWASACNFVAVAPGQLIAYRRNEYTLQALARDGGYRIVDGDEFLTGQDRLEEGERVVLTFEAAELVRGGGGPRCMTQPVRRADIA